MKCESWAAVGMGTDTSRIKGTLRLALQSQAIEWGWGSGRGNPSSLLHCSTGAQAPPRPPNPGLGSQPFFSRLGDPDFIVVSRMSIVSHPCVG